MALRERVRSGDVDNIEAQASRKFWPVYLQDTEFRRNMDGQAPNNMLNYGYMVMRAAVARALCSAGLLPSLGIHHHNRYNAFCLADDMLEPFRGFVEEKVREIEDKIADLKARWPPHSVPPSMWRQLEELEAELEEARKREHR